MKVSVSGTQQVRAALQAEVKRMFGGNMYALVGYGQGLGTGGLVERAYTNHFGIGNVPARPFLDVGVEIVEDQINKTAEKMMPKLTEGKIKMDVVLDVMGQIAVGGVQHYITELKQPGNSEYTKKIKGSSNPLIDTGNMRQYVSFEKTNQQPEETGSGN